MLCSKAKSAEQKKIWCQEIKKLMIESCDVLIPDRAKEVVLGTRNDGARTSEPMLPGNRISNVSLSPTSSE